MTNDAPTDWRHRAQAADDLLTDIAALCWDVMLPEPREGGPKLHRTAWDAVCTLRADLTTAQAEASLLQQEVRTHRAIGDGLAAEVDRLRAQVAELQALGVSLHKAADVGAQAERVAVVAFLTGENDARCRFISDEVAMRIERGEHRREEKE